MYICVILSTIHMYGPHLAKAENLEKSSLQRHFGRGRWNFITLANNVVSSVTKRLRGEEYCLHFSKYELNYAIVEYIVNV